MDELPQLDTLGLPCREDVAALPNVGGADRGLQKGVMPRTPEFHTLDGGEVLVAARFALSA